ncbi:MAG: hypothetical protein IRZ05_02810 [Micromonosporaceae bacterium]|jgi:hypothetical protein|nr:hypothetical protein [Micromonosporaceae bacterium]
MTDVVPLRPGDEALVRMPTVAEHRAHHLDQDEPVIEIRRQDGRTEVYGARRVTVLADSSAS